MAMKLHNQKEFDHEFRGLKMSNGYSNFIKLQVIFKFKCFFLELFMIKELIKCLLIRN